MAEGSRGELVAEAGTRSTWQGTPPWDTDQFHSCSRRLVELASIGSVGLMPTVLLSIELSLLVSRMVARGVRFCVGAALTSSCVGSGPHRGIQCWSSNDGI